MVTVSVLESSSGESAQRIAFILSFLLDKERTVKDFRFPKLQCTAVLSYQITRNNLLVEQVPPILVTERTDALLKELPGSIIITAGLHFLMLFTAPSTWLQLLLSGSSFMSPTIITFACGLSACSESAIWRVMPAANSRKGDDLEPP